MKRLNYPSPPEFTKDGRPLVPGALHGHGPFGEAYAVVAVEGCTVTLREAEPEDYKRWRDEGLVR